MRSRSFLLTALVVFSASSAWCQAQAIPSWGPQVSKSVFEVVLKKLDADPFVYEERLPLELVPYSERIDTQFSIGTAFAIGGGRFVSAAHVFSLESQTLREPIALRDSEGKVHPVGNVVAYSNRRDFVVFEVPGLDAAALPLSKDFSLNTRVYAVGNALGEGIIIRDGLLTSTTPEERNGDWKWLRFSAPASPGNSGGPLLDEAGRVIGIVLRKSQNENLNYALPISEMDLKPVAVEDIRGRYRLPNLTQDAPVEGATTFALPMQVTSLREKLHGFFADLERAAARTLANKQETLFPLAPGSEPSLGNSPFTTLPRFVVQQPDGTWQIQGTEKPLAFRTGDGGSVQYGDVWRYSVFSLSKPPDVGVADLFGKPRVLMDTILKGVPRYRTISTKQVRIASFGDPSTVDSFDDSYGRRWLMVRWDVPFADMSELLVALPTPSGVAGVLAQCSYAEWPAYESDIRFLADFLVLSYSASLKDWKEFLASRDLRPRLMDSLQLSYTQDASFVLDTPRLNLSITPSLLGITDGSRLTILPAYFREGGRGIWEVAGLGFSESATTKTYLDVTKILRPEPGAPDQAKQTWAALSKDSSPFNGGSYQANGMTTMISVRHPSLDGKQVVDPVFLYAVVLGLEGSVQTADAQTRFNMLKNGFTLKPSEAASAASGSSASPTQGLAVRNGKTIFQAVATGDEDAVKAFLAAKTDLEALNEDQRSPLLLALRLGKKEIASDLLAAGVPVKLIDRFGNTPLILALRYADPATARALVDKGADVTTADPDGFTPLMIAMDSKFADLPELLLSKGANPTAVSSRSTSALTFALLNGRGPLARELVKRGAKLDLTDKDGWTILMLALRYSDADTVRFLLDSGCPLVGKTNEGWTPLHLAARYGTPGTSLLLLRAGVSEIDSPNKLGTTPLMLEAQYGTAETVASLLSKGANPLTRDNQGWTALSYALRYGDIDRVHAILARLHDLPAPDSKGWTAMHFAARYMPEALQDLGRLGKGFLNARSTGGWTPILMAIENGSLSAVRWLVENGADASLRNDDGKNALDLAHAEKKTDIESYLRGVTSQGEPARKLTLTTGDLSLFQGNTYQLAATVSSTDQSQPLRWSSGNPLIASVDSSGLVTAASTGVVTITATASDGVTAQCRISVWAPDGNGYVQFKTDNLSAKGWWDKSFPGDAGWPAGDPVEVSVNKVSGDGTQGFGFQYCFRNARNFYQISVNTMGEFIVQKREEGTYSTLIPWTANGGLRKGFGQENKISVVRASANFFVITFNDNASTRVAYTDPAFASGYVMFYVSVGSSEDFPSVPEDVRFKVTAPATYP